MREILQKSYLNKKIQQNRIHRIIKESYSIINSNKQIQKEIINKKDLMIENNNNNMKEDNYLENNK